MHDFLELNRTLRGSHKQFTLFSLVMPISLHLRYSQWQEGETHPAQKTSHCWVKGVCLPIWLGTVRHQAREDGLLL